jgi:hypothetical protein
MVKSLIINEFTICKLLFTRQADYADETDLHR